ncbi:MAG: hypothetical protein ABIA75_11490 [Candidatus Neomarinimicrobiota bacterium]
MKTTIAVILVSVTLLFGQDNVYPLEDYYGGGIGYSPIFLLLDYNAIGALAGLSGLGLDKADFSTPYIIHGGEGFTHMSGHWRLGGYAGSGVSRISSIDTTGGVNKSVEAGLALMLGAATVEYAIPLFRDLEIAIGVLAGVGRANLVINQTPGSPDWNEQFSVVYGTAITVAHATDLSGTFFNLQPYLTLKWQLLDRVGLRLSAGYNRGAIGAGRWILNGREPVSNSPESIFSGIAFRTMLYFGI